MDTLNWLHNIVMAMIYSLKLLIRRYQTKFLENITLNCKLGPKKSKWKVANKRKDMGGSIQLCSGQWKIEGMETHPDLERCLVSLGNLREGAVKLKYIGKVGEWYEWIYRHMAWSHVDHIHKGYFEGCYSRSEWCWLDQVGLMKTSPWKQGGEKSEEGQEWIPKEQLGRRCYNRLGEREICLE